MSECRPLPILDAIRLAEQDAIPQALRGYDHIILAFSGGKDSLACLLHLLELGAPRERIELWHHAVDGREGAPLMDWPCTPAYCAAVARAFGLPLYSSWRIGGFEREMLKDQARTAAVRFETPDGLREVGGVKGKIATRRRFPQVSADLRVRWCSAYLKIDVASIALRNQDRFRNKQILFITGERAEESQSRARYAQAESHRTDNWCGRSNRRVDHWRPVHAWSRGDVWEILRRHRVQPHPAYRLGWGRLSCGLCIFGNGDQWASGRLVLPQQFQRVGDFEGDFGVTIRQGATVHQLAAAGTPYPWITPELIAEANDSAWNHPVFVEGWRLPPGAGTEQAGPT